MLSLGCAVLKVFKMHENRLAAGALPQIPIGDLSSPLGGGEVAVCPTTLALPALLLTAPNPFTKIRLCFAHLRIV